MWAVWKSHRRAVGCGDGRDPILREGCIDTAA
jgi:hypothetical protein